MADWFAKLMERGRARARPADVANLDARDPRYDAIIQLLRDRAAEDREAREKRQRGYRQSLESEVGAESTALPIRLHRFRTKVPCRVTLEARTLLDQLRKRFSGCTVTFPQMANRQQAIMLSGASHTERKQIGVIEHCVETDPKLCNVRNQGLSVETDDGTQLVLRFRYPLTAVRMCSKHDVATDGATCVEFTEIRPALDPRPSETSSSPRLVWITRPEIETMNAVRSRDYEAFYVRFKLEVQAGIWNALSALFANLPGTRWHRGSCFTLVREPDASSRKIYQKTVDDSGCAIDIGLDRIYDAAPATDILLLYLEGDILADIANIYFTLQSLSSADAYFVKEEFFTVVRRFWTTSQSLASCYGSDLATVVRMSQRAAPMPTQAPLLKQDWTNLRQSLVDRYGIGGWKAPDLVGQDVYRPRSGAMGWPFSSFPAGEVNVGLRIVYRQEWRDLGAERGEVIRRVPPVPNEPEPMSATTVETTIEEGATTRSLEEVVDDAVEATVEAMKWSRDTEGSIHIGVRSLAARTDMGLELECRESTRETSTRLSDMIMRRMTSMIRDETEVLGSTQLEDNRESSCASDVESSADQDVAATVHSRLENRYEVLTRLAEVDSVVLVAEKLPAPGEIDGSWVRRHDWILAKVLLNESFREALDTIGQAPATAELGQEAMCNRLCEHVRANILHYQRAIWQQEDPQQRWMRYRKSGKKVPLEWRFELELGGALTIDQLIERLAGANVDAQFAAYTAGREADLDQVIDPAGPIGYCGNYAVYHMRPEFGSDDLFSMLHFFKSPYLRPNPKTGAAEVEDPVQIQFFDDPSIAATSDQAIGPHRDTARSLFRRERARQIALDTGGLVIDVIRRVALAPAPPEPGDEGGGIELGEATDGCQLILEGNREIELLSANGQWDAGAEWAILRNDEERMLNSLTGVVGTGAHTRDHTTETFALLLDDGKRMPELNAGRAGPQTEPAILAGNGQLQFTAIADGGAEVREPVIVRRSNGARAPDLSAGRAHDAVAGRLVLAGRDGGVRLTTVAGGGAAPAHERVIVTGDDGLLRPILVAE